MSAVLQILQPLTALPQPPLASRLAAAEGARGRRHDASAALGSGAFGRCHGQLLLFVCGAFPRSSSMERCKGGAHRGAGGLILPSFGGFTQCPTAPSASPRGAPAAPLPCPGFSPPPRPCTAEPGAVKFAGRDVPEADG